MSGKKFVCAFYGARDSYQVPLALEEAGRLDSLLTDYYGGSHLPGAGMRTRREERNLPASKVRGSLTALLARKLSGRLITDLELRNHLPDRMLARRLARHAAKSGADILTYEPYAVDRSQLPPGCRQIVFYYHPHVDTEDAIYAQDRDRFPDVYAGYPVTSSRWRRRTADAWKQADLILCASSFTKQSLVKAGMDGRRIAVVPYGTSMERGAWSMEREAETALQLGELTGPREAGESLLATRNPRLATGSLRLLFVGRGPVRKGLHHLLMAWNSTGKRQGDLLTIVCSARPPALQRLAEGRGDVRWLESVSGKELDRLYAEADALVVPSLCEGFGHVYLEAMGRGCAVVGTQNSALPDIGDETQGVFTVDVGDVEGLAQVISRASADSSIFRNVGEAARQRAGDFTWEKFRKGIVEATRSLL
jgi:glycosyltransferase involved in cell wall biosynthesis